MITAGAGAPPASTELAGDVPRGLAYGGEDGVGGGPLDRGNDDADRSGGRTRGVEDRRGHAAFTQDRLVVFGGERVRPRVVQLSAQGVRVRHRLTGHAPQPAGPEHALRLVGQEGEYRLAECAGVDRDHDADLGHLTGAVRSRLMVDDHHLVEEQDTGTYGVAGTARQLLGPGECTRAQLQGVQIHVAELEHGGAELMAA